MSDLTVAEVASGQSHAQALVDFIWDSPSPFHAVDVVTKRLEAAREQSGAAGVQQMKDVIQYICEQG
ncbi:MAG: hypothetical protein CL930_13415 [Deltaproteobacteria bacterium]|nr:hypothetical protein [Deltaproteobacteria bacterium]